MSGDAYTYAFKHLFMVYLGSYAHLFLYDHVPVHT